VPSAPRLTLRDGLVGVGPVELAAVLAGAELEDVRA
jgi:hypothetical protein